MVLRTPHGGGLSAGPQHSQCLEAWFAHVPGLKVVCLPQLYADLMHWDRRGPEQAEHLRREAMGY